ncbi:MAG: hypothetical protein V3V16_14285 [Melioribacteraceae bacterium]
MKNERTQKVYNLIGKVFTTALEEKVIDSKQVNKMLKILSDEITDMTITQNLDKDIETSIDDAPKISFDEWTEKYGNDLELDLTNLNNY